MKTAYVNGKRSEAIKGVKGQCIFCGSEMTPKCGEERMNHWAHKGKHKCDPWWDNETEWHRSWKSNFPGEWQEVIHTDEETGEKHIADIKTDSEWVIEFQHSPIKPEERQARNQFYEKLVWIVDGTRTKRDKLKFNTLLDEYSIKSIDPRFKHIMAPDDCNLLKKWHDSNTLVFIDFNDVDDENKSILWFLFPRVISREAYLWPLPKDKFISLHINSNFDDLIQCVIYPFLDKLIYNQRMDNEMEASRQRERLSRMNWIKIGRRGRL
jgi:hypothetical protein